MSEPEALTKQLAFDCVVMLTWSDWHTEMRGNRFHYATRLARRCPVYFVQPDLQDMSVRCEKVPGYTQLTIVHIPSLDRNILSTPLTKFLENMTHRRPLFWCYNYEFAPFYCAHPRAIRVYHASEDYFRWYGPNIPALSHVVEASDLILCVSDGVRDSLESRMGRLSNAHVVTNGCDYHFYAAASEPHTAVAALPSPRALYQGYISQKLDFKLLLDITEKLPNIAFVFAGAVTFDFPGGEQCRQEWKLLLRRPNVHYVGKLPAEELPSLMYGCDVGLIPFVREDWIVKSGFPLKTFEYLAAGLPVVSTPLDNLTGFQDLIRFASTASEFAKHLQTSLACNNTAEVERRRMAAYGQDYDQKFSLALHWLGRYASGARSEQSACAGTGERRKVYLTAKEPVQCMQGMIQVDSCKPDGNLLIVGVAEGLQSERREPVLKQSEEGTLFRRPVVPVPWWMYLVCARTLLEHTRTRWAVLFSLRLFARASQRVVVGAMRRSIRLVPIWVRRFVKRVLAPTGIRAQKDSAVVMDVMGPGEQWPSDQLVRITHTLVHAVGEIMARPDIIQSVGAEALLAGILCKKRFGCRLIYQSAAFEENGNSGLPPWLVASLEQGLSKRADAIVPRSIATPSQPVDHLFQPHG